MFRNRKQFSFLNVHSVADADLKFKDIVVRWPGSVHDSHIFRNSLLCQKFERGNFGDSLIVGDTGYPIKPYLITPLREVHNEAQALFNESLVRTRNTVERKYGVSKRKFPALAVGIRLKNLNTLQAMIVSTAILHNIVCDENERQPPLNQEQGKAVNLLQNIDAPPP
nr:unnamed protein product [Callosobruchus analis]